MPGPLTPSGGGRRTPADVVVNADLLVMAEDVISRHPRVPVDQPPLLLMPLRLEYRVVTRRGAPYVVDRDADRAEPSGSARDSGDRPTRRERSARAAAAEEARIASERAVRKAGLSVSAATLSAAKEIWFRWYPDENFSERGITPPAGEETSLLAEFQTKLAGKPWWNLDDPATAELWQAFASAVGPYRALHLVRGGGGTAAEQEARMGRIAALPEAVELFALSGEELISLGRGAALPKNETSARGPVGYIPQAIGAKGWLTDFQLAVEQGMGIRISDPRLVKSALAADWIVAVGVSAEAGKQEFEALLRDRVANGQFEFLPQDTPTNNSPNGGSPLRNPHADPRSFLAASAQPENGAIAAAPADHNASLFAEALGLDPAVVRRIPRAAGTDFVEAQAMLRVIGPAIFDGALDGATILNDVDENMFIDVLASAFVARGALPAVRSGHGSYGIAPITDVSALSLSAGAGIAGDSVRAFLGRYATAARQVLPEHSQATSPVLRPGDPEASDKLVEILKTDRVSARLDVGDVGSSSTAPIGCPYVAGSAEAHRPEVYLRALRTTPIAQLADPNATNRSWPLLYRLARLSLTRNTESIALTDLSGMRPSLRRDVRATASPMRSRPDQPEATGQPVPESSRASAEADAATVEAIGTFSVSSILASNGTPLGISSQPFALMQSATKRFAAALEQLERVAARPGGSTELEMLMVETVDFLQHRVDAWATGLAFDRLRSARRGGSKGMAAGYYGFVGKLRQENRTGNADGYIQAPSTMQATAAAVMRSAYLRHRQNGAFAINLRSRRVRRALDVMDLLQRGLSLNEALGMRGERWLRDNEASPLIATMRDQFPLKTVTPAGDSSSSGEAVDRRLFDGLAAIAASTIPGSPSEKQAFSRLREELSEDLDTVSDVVTAEAVYQRSIGAAGPANSWLQVLSGGALPGVPQFLRTVRQSQGSTYRVARLLDANPNIIPGHPRSIAEPSLAAFAAAVLTGFDEARVEVRLTVAETGSSALLDFSLEDLDLAPTDLVQGGESEVTARARNAAIQKWIADPALGEALGSIEALSVADALAQTDVAVMLDTGDALVASLLVKAGKIRKTVQAGRPLEPGDLSAAASPAHPLTEARERDLTLQARDVLAARASVLVGLLSGLIVELADARRAFGDALDKLAEALADPQLASVAARKAEAEALRKALLPHLQAAARWAEPGALRPFTLIEALADRLGLDLSLRSLEERLKGRVATLSAALSPTSSAAATLAQARAQRAVLVSALQKVLDGDGFVVLPPVPIGSETKPLLAAASAAAAAPTLKSWSPVRERVAAAIELAALTPAAKAYPVHEDATRDDPDPGDPGAGGANLVPRSYHFGTFIADSDPAAAMSVAGFVIDEWADQVPSERQMGGLAINYDSPQAEAPNCLLLCVPPDSSLEGWTSHAGAEMVREAIAWMRVRALTTTDKLGPGALLPNGNQVAPKPRAQGGLQRIPKQLGGFIVGAWHEYDAAFVGVEAAVARAAKINERTRFGGAED